MRGKFLSRRIPAALVIAALLLGFAVVLEASDSFTVTFGANSTITAFSTCKKVTNNSVTGKNVYIPTQSSAEWTSFYTNPPAGVTLGNCAPKVIFLTSGTTWTVPSDWNSSNNTIEVIGGGGNSASPYANAAYAGGGGGAYAKTSNIELTPGAAVTYGVGGPGGDTFFNATSLADAVARGPMVAVGAQGGAAGNFVTAGAGGAAASSVGQVTYSGGAGGSGLYNGLQGGGAGGGGAAGPNGHGQRGGNASSGNTGGAGGGGANGGLSTAGGDTPGYYSGTSGGNNRLGAGAGAPGSRCNINGSPGTNGGGGGGGGGCYRTRSYGGAGSQEIVWTQTSDGATAGPAGGSGGGWMRTGTNGTNYGGGAGASYFAGIGAPGIIVITYY